MQVETALIFESVEQIYERVFRSIKPRTPVPSIQVRFRRYANANSRIRLAQGQLTVDISDLLQEAPASVQEALANILLGKLYRKQLDPAVLAQYRCYLNRSDVRSSLHLVKRERGRKTVRDPRGQYYDLCAIFEQLNFHYFGGLMARPELGWSVRASRMTLGHYDPSHHVIVISRILDAVTVPRLIVEFVMFHEMLHLQFPTETRGARRCVHTPEFKKAEKKFEHYCDAKAALRSLLEEIYRNA